MSVHSSLEDKVQEHHALADTDKLCLVLNNINVTAILNSVNVIEDSLKFKYIHTGGGTDTV